MEYSKKYEFFEELIEKDLLTILNISNVKIPIMKGGLSLSFSGGIESTLLLYLLLQNSYNKIYACTIVKGKNNKIDEKRSIEALNACVYLTKNKNVEHIVEYVGLDTEKNSYIKKPIELKQKKYTTYHYTGITANPPKDIADSFIGPEYNQDHYLRDPLINRKVIDDDWITPFWNVDKLKIASIYKELDLMENLFPFTNSCESNNATLLNHCGQCWQCKERQWGFNIKCK